MDENHNELPIQKRRHFQRGITQTVFRRWRLEILPRIYCCLIAGPFIMIWRHFLKQISSRVFELIWVYLKYQHIHENLHSINYGLLIQNNTHTCRHSKNYIISWGKIRTKNTRIESSQVGSLDSLLRSHGNIHCNFHGTLSLVLHIQ